MVTQQVIHLLKRELLYLQQERERYVYIQKNIADDKIKELKELEGIEGSILEGDLTSEDESNKDEYENVNTRSPFGTSEQISATKLIVLETLTELGILK